MFPGAPFSGTWNLANYAPPYSTDPYNPSHHTPWNGNWATDFYQVQFTQGILYMVSNDGTPQATMFRRSNSCLDPNQYAGEAYEFNLSNSSGVRGKLVYAHVSNWDPVNYQEYPIIQGQVLGNGALVGWVAYWGVGYGVGECYKVYTDEGNHFHVEMGNSALVGHLSCYYPYVPSAYRYAGDYLGIAGANTTSEPETCV